MEWTWYDPVIKGIQSVEKNKIKNSEIKAQFIFCIDDRSCSLRRHVESQDACFVTYGTPGFFGVPIYYKQEGSKFLTKLCPANAEPKHLIIEKKQKKSKKPSTNKKLTVFSKLPVNEGERLEFIIKLTKKAIKDPVTDYYLVKIGRAHV